MGLEESNIGRRNFLQMTGAGIVAASAGATTTQAVASSQSGDSETLAGVTRQPSPEFAPDLTTADIMVETLISWGATHCFGVVGDGINSIIEALRKRQDRIKYIGVRHEEAAAFMASGFAKHTDQLGVCVGTTGPGAVHLLNGLYDAYMDGAPVVAITGMTFHDLIGTRYQQGIDTTRLMQDVAQCRGDRAGTRCPGDQPGLPRGTRRLNHACQDRPCDLRFRRRRFRRSRDWCPFGLRRACPTCASLKRAAISGEPGIGTDTLARMRHRVHGLYASP